MFLFPSLMLCAQVKPQSVSKANKSLGQMSHLVMRARPQGKTSKKSVRTNRIHIRAPDIHFITYFRAAETAALRRSHVISLQPGAAVPDSLL